MTPVLARAAPLRFLIGVMLCWTLARAVMLADWPGRRGASKPSALMNASRAPPRGSLTMTALLRARPADGFRPVPRAASVTIPLSEPTDPDGEPDEPLAAAMPEARFTARPVRQPDGETAGAGAVDRPSARTRSHWSGSIWVFARGGGRSGALAPVGQIGGGQAGERLLYRLDESGRLAASGRVSRTIGGPRQTEAAIGFDWRPDARLPLHVMAERRIAIDQSGRNAWTLGVAGGAYAIPLGARWRLDGYGQAGIVGLRRRDLYADGAVRVTRAIDLGRDASLALGGGLWGAAQPGAQRMDLGPTAVLRLPVARQAMSVALDWRQRVAGDARPGSGAALTVAMDF